MIRSAFFIGRIIVLIFLLPIALYATKRDSLAQALAMHKTEDSVKVDLLLRYCRELRGSHPDSIRYFADEAIRISTKIQCLTCEASSLHMKGVAFQYSRDLDSSILCYQKSLDMSTNKMRVEIKLKNLVSIAYVKLDMNDSGGADALMDSVENIFKKLDENSIDPEVLTYAGNFYANRILFSESYDKNKAEIKFRKALELAEKKGDKTLLSLILIKLGDVLLSKKLFKESEELIDRGYALAISEKLNEYQFYALCYKAELMLNKGNFKEAERLAEKSMAIQGSLFGFDTDESERIHITLGEIYEKTFRFKEAAAIYGYMWAAEKVLNYNEKNPNILLQYQQVNFIRKEARLTAEHEKAVALAEAENQRQRLIRNTAIGVALLIIAGLVAGYFLYKKRLEARRLQKEAELQAEISETEMKALRAQMNPHFIFNSLNSISDYISKNKTQLADTYLTKFAKLMRLILENSEYKEVALADDLQALEIYMQLEALRLNDKFEYTIDVEESLDTENTLVPPLLLQPFVENSIWHGIARKDGPGRITVSVKRDNDMLRCTVEDDGVGWFSKAVSVKPDSSAHKKSLGMKITRERIDMINKTTGSKADIQVTDLEPGTRVEVMLPLVA